MGIKSRQRRRQQAAGRASAGNAGVPRGFNPRTGEFDGTGMSQDEILALYEELAAEERRRRRGGRVRYSEGNAVMKLWNGLYRLFAVVAVVLIASFTQLFPTAQAYDRRRGRDPNARFGDDAGDEGAENVGGAGGSGPEKPAERHEPDKPTDPFETLGLDKSTATADDVAKAFKRMAIKWHPDKNLDREEEAKHMMQTINAARARCVRILEGGVDPEERDDADFDPAKPADGDDDAASASDDDVGGADHEAKARRRAERAHRRMYEEMQRDYERRRRQERQRVRAEARQPGARFRRQRDAHAERRARSEEKDGAEPEAGSEPHDSPEISPGGSANRSGKGSSTNRKKNRAKKDKSRFAERNDEDEEDERKGRKRLGGVESCAERMDACVHEIALAVRAHAPTLLAELLMFECPPLQPVDPDGNTPLHYVARYDPGLVETFLQVVGEGWRLAATAENNLGQTPVDMLSPEVEDLDEKTAARADRVESVKGTSPAAVEERERLEKQARERAELSRLGAERIRKITGHAQREEEKRRVLTRRTFDARGAARVAVATAASCATAYFVVWVCGYLGVWGARVWATGVFFATAVFALDRLVPREQVAEFAGSGDGQGDGVAEGDAR